MFLQVKVVCMFMIMIFISFQAFAACTKAWDRHLYELSSPRALYLWRTNGRKSTSTLQQIHGFQIDQFSFVYMTFLCSCGILTCSDYHVTSTSTLVLAFRILSLSLGCVIIFCFKQVFFNHKFAHFPLTWQQVKRDSIVQIYLLRAKMGKFKIKVTESTSETQ